MNEDPTTLVRNINDSAEFNRWCGFEVVACAPGLVMLALPRRDEMGQYSGFLHARVVGALIDIACGFAAATLVGPRLLAAHFSVNCLRSASGQRFMAKAGVAKPGKQRMLTS